MPLNPGSRLGSYEIVGIIGAGGMGEVYRARDTRLGRDVAIKVLPEHLTRDADARQRFEREARAISSLNHPHVCTLYDVGHQDGTDFLVMELVEGETLARRLEKGPLPTPELLRIGIDIADALDKAHRHGILHRDLKPLNIMLTKSGAKLMDFGLAKSAAAASSAALAQSLAPPTRTTPLTAQGAIVGTFQYMAPEQLEGSDADVRSDIFSFGAVLYEMATGKRAFDGKTTASVIAAVLERDPPSIATVQPMSPPALDRVVKMCLAKDPDERVQSAHDVKLQLEWIRDASAEAVAPVVSTRRPRRELVAWTVAGLLAIIAVAFGYGVLTRTPAEAPAVVAQLPPPAGASFALWGVAPGAPALSPDGTQIAFVAQGADGKQQLWVRRLDSPDAHAFEGTDGAVGPFWSADDRSIGYTSRGELYRIDVSGGAPVPLAAVNGAFAGTWNRAGVILFSSANSGMFTGIFRLPASGGSIEPVKVGSFAEVGYPEFLPDGTHFLFTALGKSQDSGVYAASLDGGDPRLVLRSTTRAWYAAPGYLMFVRDTGLIGTLMAQSFDADTLQLSGEPAPVAENVVVNPVSHSPMVTVSDTGTLVYDPTSSSVSNDRIMWYDRSGNTTGVTGTPGEFGSPSLSPDGRRLAISFSDGIGGKPDVWVYDLTRGVRTRVTSEPGISADAFWSPDNAHVCFVSNRGGGPFRIYQKAADGTGATAPLVLHDDEGAAEFFGSWSADGRYLVFQRPARTRVQSDSGPASGEIWAVQTSGDGKPFPVVQNGQFVAIRPALSPDAKWLAYVSDESGEQEVYVVPFPHGMGKYLVSSGGGTWPRWSHDGKELFYWQGRSMMSAGMQETNGGLNVGKSERLFQADPAPGGLGPMYDVSADGKKFVVASRGQAEAARPLTLVVNWPALLRKQ